MTGRARRGRGFSKPYSRETTEKPSSVSLQVRQQTSQPVVSKYLQSLCRVCGRPCRDGHADAENEHIITSMILKHLNIRVVQGDGLPHKICQTCSSLLMDWDCAVSICQAFQLHLDSLTKSNTGPEDVATLHPPEDVNLATQQHPPEVENGIPEDVSMTTHNNPEVEGMQATQHNPGVEGGIPEDVNMATQQNPEVPEDINRATLQHPENMATLHHPEVEAGMPEDVNMTTEQHPEVEGVNMATLQHPEVENRKQQVVCKNVKLEKVYMATLQHLKTENVTFQAVIFPEVSVCLGMRCDAPVTTPTPVNAPTPVATPTPVTTPTPIMQQAQAEEVQPIEIKFEKDEEESSKFFVEDDCMETNNELCYVSDMQSINGDKSFESDQLFTSEGNHSDSDDSVCILSDMHNESSESDKQQSSGETGNDEAQLIQKLRSKEEKSSDPDYKPKDSVSSSSSSSEEIVVSRNRLRPKVPVHIPAALKDMCLFCDDITENLLEHMRSLHKEEGRVKVFNINIHCFNDVRKDGNFIHNLKVLTEKRGSYLPGLTPYEKPIGQVYPCGFCFEFLQKSTIDSHIKICKYKPNKMKDETIQRQKYLPMMVPVQMESKLETEIANAMDDSVENVILNEPVLIELGKQLKAEGLSYKSVHTELSALTSVLCSIQSEHKTIDSIEKLLIDPNNGTFIFEATSKLTKQKTTKQNLTYNNEVNSYTVCENVKNCLFILLGKYVQSQDLDKIKKIKQFLNVFCSKWDSKITKLQRNALGLHMKNRCKQNEKNVKQKSTKKGQSIVEQNNLKVIEARKLGNKGKDKNVLTTSFDSVKNDIKCMFCNEEPIPQNMSCHLYSKHKSEPRVKQIMKCPPRSESRRLFLKKLMNEAQFKNTLKYLKTREGEMELVKKPTHERTYLPCEYCLTFIQNSLLKTHMESCLIRNLYLNGKFSRVLGECELLAQKMVRDNVKIKMKGGGNLNSSTTSTEC